MSEFYRQLQGRCNTHQVRETYGKGESLPTSFMCRCPTPHPLPCFSPTQRARINHNCHLCPLSPVCSGSCQSPFKHDCWVIQHCSSREFVQIP